MTPSRISPDSTARCEAAGVPDAVDGAKVMFMTMGDGAPGAQAVSQGRAEQAGFHVMRGQGVSAKQDVNEAGID